MIVVPVGPAGTEEWKPGKESKSLVVSVVIVRLVDEPSGTFLGSLVVPADDDAQLVELVPAVAQVLKRIVEPSGRIHGQTFAQQRSPAALLMLVVF